MLNLVNLLADGAINNASQLCESATEILRIVGWIYIGIEIVVPIILIVIGMLDLAKAVTEKSEDKIKEAQQKLIKRAIAAVLVFLVVSLVGVVMTIVGDESYEECMTCINSPWSCKIEN